MIYIPRAYKSGTKKLPLEVGVVENYIEVKLNYLDHLKVEIAGIAHHLMHLYPATAAYDPKLNGYVIVASHRADIEEGEVLK